VHSDGTTDLAWFDADGALMTDGAWSDAGRSVLQMFVHGGPPSSSPDSTEHDGSPGDSLLVMLCAAPGDLMVTLPPPPWGSSYLLLWDSAEPVPLEPTARVDGAQYVRARSLRLYATGRITG
jgi:glycogen operon protein